MKLLNAVIFCLLFASCATQYQNGVSTWNGFEEQDELLETKEYNSYSILEEPVESTIEVVTASVDVKPIGQQGQSLVAPLPQSLSTSPTSVTLLAGSSEPIATSTLDEISLTSAATRSVSAPSTSLSAVEGSEKMIVDGGRCFSHLKYPARFVSKVLKDEVAPQRYEYTELPAEYKTIKKLVQDELTGKYTYKTVRELVKPAQKVRRLIPAEHRVRKAGGAVYRDEATKLARVICKENLSTDLVSKVQKALNKSGHAAGTASGYMNAQTLEALKSYQAKNSLGVGALTLETLSSLGVYSYNL